MMEDDEEFDDTYESEEENDDNDYESEEEQVYVIPVDDIIETGFEDDTLSLVDDERAEMVDESPIEDMIEYPEGDTLSLVDDERKKQDVIDAIIASSADGGADPDMGIDNNIVVEEEDIVPYEDDVPSDSTNAEINNTIEPTDSETEDEDDEEDQISNYMNFVLGRGNGR